MIIVTGSLIVTDRGRFLTLSQEAMRLARQTPGCLEFAVLADPLEDDRVIVLERWTDTDALHAFRGEGPGGDIGPLIKSAEVGEYDAEVRER